MTRPASPPSPPALATHYTTLGLTPIATAAQIRAAYRASILLRHPDRASGSGLGEARDGGASALNAAWEVLGDEERREEYDESLTRREGASRLEVLAARARC